MIFRCNFSSLEEAISQGHMTGYSRSVPGSADQCEGVSITN